MAQIWIALADIPADGREFLFEEQEIWTGPARALGPELAVLAPLSARLRIVPQRGDVPGCYTEGRIDGLVSLPCDRCAEPAEVRIEASFQEFEEYEEDENDLGEESRLRTGPQGLELEVTGLLWEQFLLALPMKPLCRENCKGLCPRCGQNLNLGMCACRDEEFDPRMAPLRNLKLS